MIYEKLYNEIYALLSVKRLGSEYKGIYKKIESPDWINEHDDIGIEVTQALLQYEGEAQKVIDKFLGMRLEDIPQAEIEPFLDRAEFFCGRLQAINTENGTHSYVFKTLYRFDKKLYKLNTNYSLMKRNCFYIFLHKDNVVYSDIEYIFENIKVQQSRKKNKFNTVFLNCIETIYVLDFNLGIISTIMLSEIEQKKFAESTLRIRNRVGGNEDFIGEIEI